MAHESVTVERLEDMSPDGVLALTIQADGDVVILVREQQAARCIKGVASIEFCASGGRSPRTLKALRELVKAMWLDNQEREAGRGLICQDVRPWFPDTPETVWLPELHRRSWSMARQVQAARIAAYLRLSSTEVKDRIHQEQPDTPTVVFQFSGGMCLCSPAENESPPEGYVWGQCGESDGMPVFGGHFNTDRTPEHHA